MMSQLQNPKKESELARGWRLPLAVLTAVVTLLFLLCVSPSPVAADAPCTEEVDLVFVMDTSGSMTQEQGEFSDLCNGINTIVTELRARNITVTYKILGITGMYNCTTNTVIAEIPDATAGRCDDSVDASEDWGPAVADVAAGYSWQAGYQRMVIPLSDEGPRCGNPVEDPGPDRNAIITATTAATDNDVIVSPILCSGYSTAVVQLAEDLANGTGGRVLYSEPGLENMVDGIVTLVTEGVCGPQDLEVNIEARPDLTRNPDGWYEPNPFSVTVTVQNNSLDTFESLDLRLRVADHQDRLLMYDGRAIWYEPYHTWDWGAGVVQEIGSLAWFEEYETAWDFWAQPAVTRTLVFTAEVLQGTTVLCSDTHTLTIPQAQIHPMVIVPAMPGSWREHGSGAWVLDPLGNSYQPLLDELRAVGYEDGLSLFTFPYDWRRDNILTAMDLKSKVGDDILTIEVPDYIINTQVDIVAHSMGNLVSRYYVQRLGGKDKTRRLISIAGPHQGSPKAYVLWAGGDLEETIEGGEPLEQMVLKTILEAWAHIEIAKTNGEITVDEAALYKLALFSQPEKLPSEFQPATFELTCHLLS